MFKLSVTIWCFSYVFYQILISSEHFSLVQTQRLWATVQIPFSPVLIDAVFYCWNCDYLYQQRFDRGRKELAALFLGIGLNQLVGQASRRRSSECISELQSKAAWSLLGKSCLCWLQAVPGEAAEMKYWQEAEAMAPLALRCLFRAVHGGFLHDKERRLSLPAITLPKQGELRFFCQKFTLVSKINVSLCS